MPVRPTAAAGVFGRGSGELKLAAGPIGRCASRRGDPAPDRGGCGERHKQMDLPGL
jgi:hypothetical protein